MRISGSVLLCGLILISIVGLHAQSPEWLWATSAGGPNYEVEESIATDSQGYVYITGRFSETANFGSISLTSSGNSDTFVAKLDTNGNWLWAIKAGGSGSEEGLGIAVDGNSNIYITGVFNNTATFGATSLNSSGNSDIFVAKLDTNGNWLWARRAGGSNLDGGRGVAIDINANVYLTGCFEGTANFGSTSLTSSGNWGIFAAKLDSNGNWIWAVQSGGGTYNVGYDIVVDSDSNCYLTGRIIGDTNFGTVYLSSSGGSDVFVAKLDSNGNWLWAKSAGGTGSEEGYGIAVDNAANVCLIGVFTGIAIFGSVSLYSSGEQDVFCAKLDTNGNWLWARSAGGAAREYGYGIDIDSEANLYVCGTFLGAATFGPHSLTSIGIRDVFVAKLDANGDWLWVKQAGGTSANQCYGIAIDSSDNIFLTGDYRETINFGLIPVTSNGGSDLFVVKLGSPRPVLETPISLTFGNSYLGYYIDNQDLWLKNIGTTTLTVDSLFFSLNNSPFSVLSSTTPYTIIPGDSLQIQLRFTPQVIGSVTDSLCIYNDSDNLPLATIRVNGTGVVIPPKPPQNLQIVLNGNDVYLSWELVSETIFDTPISPDYYFIYNANKPEGEFVLNGLTHNTSYIHPYIALGANRMFYRVTAVKFYREDISPAELDSYLKKNITTGMRESDVQTFLNEFK